MNRFMGYKYNEIADEMGLSVKTIEKHMSSALRLLRFYIRNENQ